MPQITAQNGIVTQITTVAVTPDKQDEALRLMKERAHFMAKQPGFISISLHRAKDGGDIVNYVQWKNRDQLAAAHPGLVPGIHVLSVHADRSDVKT